MPYGERNMSAGECKEAAQGKGVYKKTKTEGEEVQRPKTMGNVDDP